MYGMGFSERLSICVLVDNIALLTFLEDDYTRKATVF